MKSSALPLPSSSTPRLVSTPTRPRNRKRSYHLLGHDFRIVTRDTGRFLNANRWKLSFIFCLLLTVCILVINPHDASLLKSIRSPRTPFLKEISGQIGYWGDFAQYNLGLAFIIWMIGYLRRSRTIQRLAVATIIGATLAGMTCNIFRFTLGRPRPHAKMADGFYGIEVIPNGAGYQSFPSGHTSTAFGTSTPLLVAGGPIGYVATAFSSSVAWARMYRNKHYPTDIIIGLYLGIVFGVASSFRLYRIRRRLRRRKKGMIMALSE